MLIPAVVAILLAQPAPDAATLRRYHELLAAEPHMAGTDGDARTIERLRSTFAAMGIADVQVHEFWPLLAHPIAAELEIVAPDRMSLDLRERVLRQDPASADPNVVLPFNAYSGSGEVTAGVVYANYATKADFERLAALGVDCRGKIVLARYGGNFRGYKAKFAQAAGAAGLIIYTDPADVGYMRGIVYPEGVWANDCCVQRGSISTLGYQGDPLTPGLEATRDAPRLAEKDLALPSIPVQPVGYAAAKEILARMSGAAVPEGWQGGLPTTYRLEGGPDLRVRLKVQQDRAIRKTANVLATIPGAVEPDTLVLVGCHHDAWVNGASDPLCGTIVLLEAARWLQQEAAAGRPPRRTVVFGAWGAEEFGIIGSTEWVEANRNRLRANGAAYINLDMASMGVDFGASASPSMRAVLRDAAKTATRADGISVFEAWKARIKDAPADWPGAFDDLGGGSDHVGFLCYAGVPSAAVGGGGSKGYSYHSAYDSLPWYWRAVGGDYAAASMVASVTIESVRRLAYDEILPLDPSAYADDLRSHAKAIAAQAEAAGLMTLSEPRNGAAHPLRVAFTTLDAEAGDLVSALRDGVAALRSSASTDSPSRANAALLAADRVWLDEAGLTGRPWFKSRYAAPDEDSGYAAWVLPELRHAVSVKDGDAAIRAIDDLRQRLRNLREVLMRR